VNVVAVVPEPGETVPAVIVIVPHVRATTGDAPPAADTSSQLASISAPTMLRPIRCRDDRVGRGKTGSMS
jgi:hypothetical protein